MNRYLREYLQLLPKSQREKLEELFRRDREKYYSLNIEDISDFLEEERVFEPTEYEGLISSSDYNSDMSNLYADLSLLFNQLQVIENFSKDSKFLHMSDIEELNKELKKLQDDIESIKEAVESGETLSTIVERFLTSRNIEDYKNDTTHLFVDEFGNRYRKGDVCYPDTNSEELVLPETESNNVLLDNSGQIRSKINILEISSAETSEDNGFGPKNCIDGKIDTFWGQVILSDHPIESDGKSGPYIEFEIILEEPTIISQIELEPFGDYPIKVESIKCYDDINMDSTEPENLIDSPVLIEEKDTINFYNIYARRLVIKVRQKNYTKLSYLVREAEEKGAALWNEIQKDREKSVLEKKNTMDKMVYPDLLEEAEGIPGWKMFEKEFREEYKKWSPSRSTIKDLANRSLRALSKIINMQEEWVKGLDEEVINTKDISGRSTQKDIYEYVMGFYNIKVKRKSYKKEGIFISKPLTINGTPLEVELESDEVHHGQVDFLNYEEESYEDFSTGQLDNLSVEE